MPAVGKTTIAKRFIKQSDIWSKKKFKKLRFMENKSRKLIVLGIYPEDGTFLGTDLLSMAVQPDAVEFIQKHSKMFKDYDYFMEGDRLNNNKFYNEIKEFVQLKILVVKADEHVMKCRHIARSDSQSEQFLKRIETKISNIALSQKVITMENNTEEDSENIFSFINSNIWETKIKVK
jgi:dephospho-CoA kinase